MPDLPPLASIVQDGDVLLFRGTAPFSRLIEWDTGSVYSHAAGVVRLCSQSGGWEPYVVEAIVQSGVRIYPLGRYLSECAAAGCQVDWFPVRGLDRQAVARELLAHVGDPYAMSMIFESFGPLHRAWRWITGASETGLLKPVSEFCSQLVSMSLEAGGFALPRPAQYISPDQVSRFGCFGPMMALAA